MQQNNRVMKLLQKPKKLSSGREIYEPKRKNTTREKMNKPRRGKPDTQRFGGDFSVACWEAK